MSLDGCNHVIAVIIIAPFINNDYMSHIKRVNISIL